jgi:tetratricopeptide (TPR) repeat protein
MIGPARAQNAMKSSPKTVDSLVGGIVDELHEYMDNHWHRGEYNHILNLGKIAIAIDPTDKDVYANSGWLLWSMDRDQEAVDLYLKGVKAMPKSFYMYDELGFYYMNRKKDIPTAIKYYEQAVDCKDVGTITLHMLANCYERTNQPDKALKIWERAAENPADAIAKTKVQRLQKKP